MQLTAQQIIEEGLLKLDNTQGKPAQVGYDLSLKHVNRVLGSGMVLKDKTTLGTYQEVAPGSYFTDEGQRLMWYLEPGAYDVVFHEGCKIPANRSARICQRSSLLRNGAVIASSMFDPGFETDNIGTVMIVIAPIYIEVDARVAQIYFVHNDEVHDDHLYDGQWQKDKQRVAQ